MPQFEHRDYDKKMVLGSLAAGGALGSLIPPSTTFIVYAMLTETSVGKLYAAAVVPGLLVAGLCLVVIFIHGLRRRRTDPDSPRIPLKAKLIGSIGVLPTLLLIGVVLGSMYSGIATATEAAAFGTVGAAAFAAFYGRLSLRMLHQSAMAAARNTAMIGLILIAAFMLNYVLTSLGVPQAVVGLVTSLPLPPWGVIAVIVGLYLALGTFMEGFSIIVTTIPIVFPVVQALGYDPIWFGVVVVLLIEIALITPPDGTVMYVLQGVRPNGGPITDIFTGVVPFVGAYLAGLLLIIIFPQIVLFAIGH